MTALTWQTLQFFCAGVDSNFCISDELLDKKSLKSTTTGKDLFETVSCVIENMNLPWAKLCGITMDGAPSMIGEQKGMASMVHNKVCKSGGEAVKMHCIIHQEAFCAKAIQMDDVMTTVAIHMWANIFADDAEQESTESQSDWQPSLWSASYLYTTCSWLDISSEIQGTTSLVTSIKLMVNKKKIWKQYIVMIPRLKFYIISWSIYKYIFITHITFLENSIFKIQVDKDKLMAIIN